MGWPVPLVRQTTPAAFAAALDGFARSKNPDAPDPREAEAMFDEGMAIRAEEWLAGLTDA